MSPDPDDQDPAVPEPSAVVGLRRALEAIGTFDVDMPDCRVFETWKYRTRTAIERAFGQESRYLREFEALMLHTASPPVREEFDRKYFPRQMAQAHSLLDAAIDEAVRYGIEAGRQSSRPLESVERLAARFHLVVRALRARHDGRIPLDIEDEYDVQDLFHALLFLDFMDVRREEWTPSYAGGSARMDFLVKPEQVVIEVKKSRKGMTAKTLGDELLVDLQRYQAHPDCKTLVCFVYDPDGRIANPRGVEADLSRAREGLVVKVIIAPAWA